MAKKKESAVYTLCHGRKEPFRRTVNYSGDKSAMLVFEPGVDVSLDATELEQCQDLIRNGMIVPADRDAKGRLRITRVSNAESEATIESLQQRLADLEAVNADLMKQLDEATGGDGGKGS